MAKTTTTSGYGGGSRLDIGLVGCAVASGVTAGVALAKSNFYMPGSLRAALKFENESIYIILLAFCITSIAGNMISNVMDRDNRIYISHRGSILGALGSIVTGLGMALAGSDMLGLWVQIGTGCEAAMYTTAGAMLAGVTFFMVLDRIRDNTRMLDEPYVDRIISRKRNMYPFVAGGLLVVLLALCGVVNINGVTSGPTPKVKDFVPDPRKSNWSPYLVGAILGLAGFVLRIFYRARLHGYCGFISAICFPVNQISRAFKTDCPVFVRYMGSVESLWVFILGASVTGGALLSAYLSSDLSKIKSQDWIISLIGGYFMMAGSLLAEGDLFSQLSGAADLHIPSMINVACICLGGFIYNPVLDLIKKVIK